MNGFPHTNSEADHIIGQKQYELVNHLANVQETISDKKYSKDLNGDGIRDEFRAASVMVYDYYPFGMLMPGRSLDTAGLCLTSTSYTEVPHPHWANGGQLSNIGGGGASSYGGASLSNLSNGGISASGTGGGISYTITGIPAYYADLVVYFNYLSGPTTITVYQGTNTGVGSTQLGSGTLTYTSPAARIGMPGAGSSVGGGGTVTVVVTNSSGGYPMFSIDSIGYSWTTFTLNSTLYTRCGDPKDRYEFGFNGKLKDNEIAGVGNSLDFGARMYNPRIGKFLALDPLSKRFPSESNYGFAGNNPIYFIDRDGKLKVSALDEANYWKSYPMIMTYLENQIEKDVKKSTRIVRTYASFRNNSENKNFVSNPDYMTEIFKWRSGPTIVFEPNPGWPMAGANGHFSPACKAEDDQIELNSNHALKLEKILKSKVSEKVKQAAFMKFYMTILHEVAHKVNTPDNVVNTNNPCIREEDKTNTKFQQVGEEGYKFQQEVWGTDMYKPYDVSNDPGASKNQTAYDPGVVEDVIKNANSTPEGRETLPTVPTVPNTAPSK